MAEEICNMHVADPGSIPEYHQALSLSVKPGVNSEQWV